MDVLPLTPEELALLRDPARAALFAHVPLAGRLIEDLDIDAITWNQCSFAGSLLRGVVFRNCVFSAVDFEDVGLEGVRFERCSFEECRFMRARLDGSQFLDCRQVELYWRDSQLTRCGFERSEISGGWFEGTAMQLWLHGGSLGSVRFVRCVLDAQLTEVRAEQLRFTLCTIGRFAVQHCSVDNIQLLGGSCAALLWFGGTVRDVRCGELALERLEVEQVPEVETLHLNACNVGELSLLESVVSDLYVFQTDTRRLSIQGGRVSGWFTHSRCHAGSSVVDAELEAFFWDESSCEGLTLSRTHFVRGLCARGTLFRGLRLDAPHYAPELKLVLDGAQFEDSDSFGGASP